MKKFFFPIILASLFVLVVGFFYFSKNKPSLPLTQTNKQQPSAEKPTEKKNQEKSGVFSSLKDALAGNQSVKCEFTDDQGKKTTMYFKKNLVRGIYEEGQEMNNFLYRDNKMYTWDETKKQGFILPIPTLAVTATKEKPASPEDYALAYEKYWRFCQTTSLDNSLFTPPANVQFEDVSNFQQMMGR